MNKFNRYLGDGVYASFDGYQIWLAANNHNNKVIALEPEVFAVLVKYKNDIPSDINLDNDDYPDNI